jgi:glycosyltransferase involved in cell wall biosynthesis
LKLVIQIPCFNEEASLPETLAALPRALSGFDSVEWLVVDDGSHDATARVARQHGADHVLRLSAHRGLAQAFAAGIRRAVELGADVIVNTDADNQYLADDIPALVAPILDERAEIVVGARPIERMRHFSLAKRLLQRLGSRVVRRISGARVEDAPSGFRAMTRAAAMRLTITSDFSYTLESLIQAGLQGFAIASVPVRVNSPRRPSRLMRSMRQYVAQSAITIWRIYVAYRPLRFFVLAGLLTFLPGLLLGLRFVFYWAQGAGEGKVQSLILAALLMGAGFFLGTVGVLADLIAVNRKLLEEVRWELRTLRDEQPTAERGGATGDGAAASGAERRRDGFRSG